MSHAELGDGRPKLTFVLEHEGPIPLAAFTLALQRLAARYAREAKITDPDEEPKLYISEIRKGSVVVDFVAHHSSALAMGGLAMVGAANTLYTFGDNLKKLVDRFLGKHVEPVTKADCDDVRALAGVVIQTLNATLNITVNENGGRDLVKLPEAEARAVDNRAALERQKLSLLEENIFPQVLLVWDQVRDAPAVDVGRSPDRAIISAIDPRPRQVTFASEEIKERMGRRDFNPFEKAFVVDVKVLLGPNGPVGYRVLELHDVLDRE